MSERGIFTTIAIRNGEPFLWEKHWARLTTAAGKLNIDLSEFSESVVKTALMSALEDDAIQNGRAKITFTDERPGTFWSSPPKPVSNTSLNILTGTRREIPNSFRVGISPFPVNSHSPLAGLKTTNYLEPTLCFEAAKAAGFDEAIRLNEQGHITSACFANVFWLKDDRLFTPELSTGCLAGTTREFILENLEVHEITAGIDEIRSADAVFLTSAGIGIAPAASLAETVFVQKAHSILGLIKG
ncbi:MAG: aminotransferase class IV [Pyrinomonadaceae bacterium]